jgi:tetratricopeptide (TPR) repeat protein
MERLGQTYLHAGFLERARAILTEILRKQPRTPSVLYKLGIVYEMMHEYDKALEVIEPLSEQGGETKALKIFLEFEQVSSNKQLPPQEKVEKLLEMLELESALYRPIIALLFRLDTPKAWEQINKESLHSILDILWFLPYPQLDFDIISQDKNLTAIYYARGDIKQVPSKSGIFTIDMLAAARTSGFEDGDLLFSYLCKKCKQSFPVSFVRCPNCLALNSIKVEENIAKHHTQTNHSLL